MATPMQEQYFELKKKYHDCILLFRLGDFYEGFNEDAKTLSKVLGLALTGRGQDENRVPMAGIPHHALHQYLPKLIKAGYKVAIADQLEDPKPGQIVKRDVTKVVTAGTVIDENNLALSVNNYLASVYYFEKKGVMFWGFSYADISTGEFKVNEYVLQGEKDYPIVPKEILIELFRLRPEEILIPESLSKIISDNFPTLVLTTFPDTDYYFEDLKKDLQDHFKVTSLKGFGMEDMRAGTMAAGKLIQYFYSNRKFSMPHITGISLIPKDEVMLLDESTIRSLELVYPLRDQDEKKTLYGVLNNCLTPMGMRLLRYWILHPLKNVEKINERLDAVSVFFDNMDFLSGIRNELNEIVDMERIVAKLSGRSANARDLLFLRIGLEKSLTVIKLIKGSKKNELEKFVLDDKLIEGLEEQVCSLIGNAIKDDPALTIQEGNIIKDGYNKELDLIRQESIGGKDFIKSLEAKEIERTGINSLKVRYNRVFGYYIEVTKSHLDKVPADYIRKQTLVNCERFITQDLKVWEEKVLGAEEKINQMEFEIFEDVRGKVLAFVSDMHKVFENIAQIDVLVNYAHNAHNKKYVRPEVSEDAKETKITGSRHSVVEEFLTSDFIANDVGFDDEDQRLIILTGPNMSGKSTYIRQVAVVFLMAQIGSFVPAEKCRIRIADRIFTRVGASDNLAGGESTFMVEMNETANIMNNATKDSLVILDEVGRGTSTYDGVSIAWAVSEYLANKIKARTLFATHYHELVNLEKIYPGIRNYNVEVLEADNQVVFMHKIKKGGTDKSYGVYVAGLAGVPASVIKRAKIMLKKMQKEAIKMYSAKDSYVMTKQIGMEIVEEAEDNGKEEREPDSNSDLNKEVKEAVEELKKIDINSLSPIDALNKLAELVDLIKKTP